MKCSHLGCVNDAMPGSIYCLTHISQYDSPVTESDAGVSSIPSWESTVTETTSDSLTPDITPDTPFSGGESGGGGASGDF